MAAGDFDGDGREELITDAPGGLAVWSWSGGRVAEAYRVALPSISSRPPDFAIGAAADLDADGSFEVLGSAMRTDQRAWDIWLCRPAQRSIRVLATLPGGPDCRPDGVWDGTWYVAGSLPPGAASPDAAVLVVCRTGFDWDGRCVLALDAVTGRELWRFACGPNPERLAVDDLDACGAPEVILTGNSQDNMSGARLNGSSDETAMLFVLDAHGRLRWSRALGPVFVNTHLQVLDLDGDGEVEIVTATNSHNPRWDDRLCVWSGRTGDVRAERLLVGPASGLLARFDRASRQGWIYTGDEQGELIRYTWKTGDALSVTARARGNDRVAPLVLADVAPEAGCELALLTHSGGVVVTDAALHPLAASAPFTMLVHSGAVRPGAPWRALVWHAGSAVAILACEPLGAALMIDRSSRGGG